MSVSASAAGEPRRPVRVGSRPAVMLWALLVVGLLTLLPCAATAKAAGTRSPSGPATAAGPHAGTGASAAAGRTAHHAAAVPTAEGGTGRLAWCSPDDEHRIPGKGCTSHPYNGPEAQLPNAPPQPLAVVPSELITVPARPQPLPLDAQDGTALAPDLHVLQVLRS